MKRDIRYGLLLTVLFSGLSHAAQADSTASPPLSTDRPGFTNGSDVVAPGRLQVEGGVAFTQNSVSQGGSQVTDLPELLVRQGLTPTLELRLSLPDYFTGGGGVPDGFGDASLGAKWKIYQSKDGNTKAALTPSLSIPFGSAAYTSSHVDPSLTFGAQTASGSRWGLSTNLALAYPTQDGSRNFSAAPSASVTYQLTTPLSVYGELYDNFPQRGGSTPIADGGFAYLVNPNFEVDAEMGLGLGSSAPVRFYGTGLGYRF